MDKWRNKRNGLPSKIHCSEKQKDILRKVIKILLDLYIIEISTTSEYSHVQMVPKPVVLVECRLTIDFVKLNECTIVMKGWLITIISLVLCQRLGVKRHTFFELIMKRIRKLNGHLNVKLLLKRRSKLFMIVRNFSLSMKMLLQFYKLMHQIMELGVCYTK